MQPLESVKIRALAHERPVLDMREVTEVVRDLVQPNPRIYWADLTVSAGLGWLNFAFFLTSTELFSEVCFFIVAVACIYRGVFFIHELSHQSKSLPGFNFGWNIMIGIPTLVPSFLYDAVHLDHHRRHKYGTIEDPEYLPLGRGTRLDIIIFIGKSILFPVAFAVRALVLAPIGLVISPFHRWLEINLSALIINESYKRSSLSEFERSRMKMTELIMFAVWMGILALYFDNQLPANFLLKWYLLIFTVGLINQTRTLVAHRYNNEGGEMEYEDQLLDSVNVEGGFFTELWAPVGARYHALHHYVPRLPYHALPEAHRRMKLKFSDDSLYSKVNEGGFMTAIKKLWKVVILTLLVGGTLAPQHSLATESDPCRARIKSSIQKKENSSIVKSGLKSVSAIVEVAQTSFSRNESDHLFGRFFQADNKNKKLVFWMLPYADGKACVLREIRVL